MRGEEADRVVAPVVGQAVRGEVRLGDELVDRQQLDRRDAEVVEVVGDHVVAQPGVRAAQLLGDPVVQRGEALDVQLVDRGVAPAGAGSAGRRPSRSRRATTTLRPTYGAESRSSRRSGSHRSGRASVRLVAVDRRVGDELAADRAGVGVEQQLVRVEAQPAVGGPRARRRGSRSAGPGRSAGHGAVPDAEAVLGQGVPGLDLAAAPSSSNRHSQTAVASGACTAKFVDSSPHVAPRGQLRPGHTATRSSAADHCPGVTG